LRIVPLELPPVDDTAVLTMELQRGVVGDLATMPALAAAAASRSVLGAAGRLVDGARAVELPVVHARVSWSPDRRGTPANAPLLAALTRVHGHLEDGTGAIDPVPELGDTSADLVSWRRHGVTPFTGTDLDPLIRSLGVGHLVILGVSLNVGVLGACCSAVDLGYRVTVPTDAVVGVPVEYGDSVVEHSLAPLAVCTTVADLIDHWDHRASATSPSAPER